MKLNEMFKTTRKEDIPYPYLSLIEDVHLSALEEFSGILSQVKGYAIELMKEAGYEDKEAEKISDRLIYDP
ncbi:MAG: hypothetical protein NDF52_00040 [archaeon YNP-WB-062]|nr:hypothetical protein [Candidatus Culexarchaeum yellowstonense]